MDCNNCKGCPYFRQWFHGYCVNTVRFSSECLWTLKDPAKMEETECRNYQTEEAQQFVSALVDDCGLYEIPVEATLEDAQYNLKVYEAHGLDVPDILRENPAYFQILWNMEVKEWAKRNASA